MNDKNYKLTDDWDIADEIVVYGLGRVCERIFPKLKKDLKIKYIVDNNSKLSDYEGIKVYKIKDIGKSILENKVVVTTSQNAYEDIRNDLETLGGKEYQHFCRVEEFILEWYWKNKNKICIPQLNSSVTSRCTFNCKRCATLMPYFKEHYEYCPQDILNDLALLFKRVDYVFSYYLVGGEPFLNKYLGDLISIIMERYSDKIGMMQIISNGTIVPDDNVILCLKKYNVQVRLSDYTERIDYSARFTQVFEKLRDNGICYSIHNYEQWMDLGFPDGQVDFGNDIDTLHRHMKCCSTGCHEINDGKLYYCGTLFYAEKSKLFKLREDDYIDLRNDIRNNNQLNQEKIRIMNYCMGEMNTKYLSLCRFCRGFGKDNVKTCSVAEQIAR